jgi:hypothetical protein
MQGSHPSNPHPHTQTKTHIYTPPSRSPSPSLRRSQRLLAGVVVAVVVSVRVICDVRCGGKITVYCSAWHGVASHMVHTAVDLEKMDGTEEKNTHLRMGGMRRRSVLVTSKTACCSHGTWLAETRYRQERLYSYTVSARPGQGLTVATTKERRSSSRLGDWAKTP